MNNSQNSSGVVAKESCILLLVEFCFVRWKPCSWWRKIFSAQYAYTARFYVAFGVLANESPLLDMRAHSPARLAIVDALHSAGCDFMLECLPASKVIHSEEAWSARVNGRRNPGIGNKLHGACLTHKISVSVPVQSHIALSRDLVESKERDIIKHLKAHLAPWAPHPIFCQSEAREEGAPLEGGPLADWRRDDKSPTAAYKGATHIPMVMCSVAERALFEVASEREERWVQAKPSAKRL